MYSCVGSAEVPKERVEIHGEQLSVVTDDFSTTRFLGKERPPVRGVQDKGHQAELEVFFECLRRGRAAPMSVSEIENVSRSTFAIVESLQSGEVRNPKV